MTSFQKNGFIKLKNVFTKDVIQVLRNEILSLLRKTFKSSEGKPENEINRGALLLVSDTPMIPEGIKTQEMDQNVTRKYVSLHLDMFTQGK